MIDISMPETKKLDFFQSFFQKGIAIYKRMCYT